MSSPYERTVKLVTNGELAAMLNGIEGMPRAQLELVELNLPNLK